jgi:CRISPR-associated protein Csh1
MRRLGEAHMARFGAAGSERAMTPEQRRLVFLCERTDSGTPVFVLSPEGPGVARLSRREMISGQSWRAPWIKPGGPNSPYLIPVFKVEPKKGGAESKRKTTVAHFRKLAASSDPVAPYFEAALSILSAKRIVTPESGRGPANIADAYTGAVNAIVAQGSAVKKGTPLLVVALDREGEDWPGNDRRLVKWLLESPERLSIYGAPTPDAHPSACCPLCGQRGPYYANALPGAGLNFVNGAFRGSFSELREDRAWQRFAICAPCADLLYIYKNHVAPAWIERVVGSKALIIPSADFDDPTRLGKFLGHVQDQLNREDRAEGERQILRRIAGDATIATISLLWADNFGQKYEEIRGLVTHVPPTRLAGLQRINQDYNNRHAPDPFPPRNQHVRRAIDLELRLAEELIYRPGGAKVKADNQSPRRLALLRELAGCVFHARRLDPGPLWFEIDRTAESYWIELLQRDNGGVLFQCNFEATEKTREGKRPPLTLNGWVRHLYLFLQFLADDRVGVLPKEIGVYEATQESLRPLLSQAEGLDTDAKRFTFLLGILYGHLIYVQARKAEVNVAANALSWMRGGRLRAAELHELYGKITTKLLEYDALEVGRYRKWKQIFELETELAHLGKRIRVPIEPGGLPDEQVLYFLMLGIALSYEFTTSGLPKDQGESR